LRDVLGELKLDEQQRAQIEKAVEGYSTKLRVMLEGVRGGKLDRNELREAVTKLADEATAELNRALTPEQRAMLERLAPRGRSLFPTPFGEATPGRPDRADPNTPDRPRPPRPNPDGGR
jgi:Spy/CpxP family protein refolding chaperone